MKRDNSHIYDLCEDHMHAYVLAEMTDGTKVDGIVTGLDEEHVYFAVPIENEHETNKSNERQYGGWHGGGYGGGYNNYGGGYPGYGYGNYGYGYQPRFRRLILPLTALAAISLLPWY